MHMQPEIQLQVGKKKLNVLVVVLRLCYTSLQACLQAHASSARHSGLARCDFCECCNFSNPTWLSSHGSQGVTVWLCPDCTKHSRPTHRRTRVVHAACPLPPPAQMAAMILSTAVPQGARLHTR